MHWRLLDREKTEKLIDEVRSDQDAGLFSLATSKVKFTRLRFYKTYMAYELTNFASLPSFTFRYLGDGLFFNYLDGTEGPIYNVNDKGELRLTEGTVLDYLSFFFQNVSFEDGDIKIITDPYDTPELDALDEDSRDALIENYEEIGIDHHTANGRFLVKAPLLIYGTLMHGEISVNNHGRVEILDRRMMSNAVIEKGTAEHYV